MIIESFPGDAKPYKCNDCDTIFLWREDAEEKQKGKCIMLTGNEHVVNGNRNVYLGARCVINDGSCIFFSKCDGPICPVCRSKYVVKVNSFYYRIARYFRNRKEK